MALRLRKTAITTVKRDVKDEPWRVLGELTLGFGKLGDVLLGMDGELASSGCQTNALFLRCSMRMGCGQCLLR
jgi:hypothetical protein